MTKSILLIFLSCLVSMRTRAAVRCEDLMVDGANQSAQFQVEIPQVGSVARREALHLFRYMLPDLFGPFSSESAADLASWKLNFLITEAATQPFFKKATKIVEGQVVEVENPLHAVVSREANRTGSFKNLWARIGLGDAYAEFFNYGRSFTASGMTLVKIYETLYQHVLGQKVYAGMQNVYNHEVTEGRHEFGIGPAPTVRAAPANMTWANQNGFLLLMNASQLPVGTVLWTEDGQHSAIVGVDADLTLKWHWGLPRPSLHRDLQGYIVPYSNETPTITIVDPRVAP